MLMLLVRDLENLDNGCSPGRHPAAAGDVPSNVGASPSSMLDRRRQQHRRCHAGTLDAAYWTRLRSNNRRGRGDGHRPGQAVHQPGRRR